MIKPADIRQYALSILELSRKFFLEDGDLDPVAFIVTADEELLRPLELRTEAEKLECCQKIVQEARSRLALAIVAVFLARSKDFDRAAFSEETYSWEISLILTVSDAF